MVVMLYNANVFQFSKDPTPRTYSSLLVTFPLFWEGTFARHNRRNPRFSRYGRGIEDFHLRTTTHSPFSSWQPELDPDHCYRQYRLSRTIASILLSICPLVEMRIERITHDRCNWFKLAFRICRDVTVKFRCYGGNTFVKSVED